MIRSMTGFGDAEHDTPAGRLRIEVKTVNHRFFNANVKTPHGFDRFERAIVDVLKAHIQRGHVSASLSIDRSHAEAGPGVNVDIEKARGYRDALTVLHRELELEDAPSLAMLARFTDVFRAPDTDRTAGVEADDIAHVAHVAAEACKAMRSQEGERLHADLAGRLEAIGRQLDVVETRAPERLVEHRDKLREAVRALSEQVEVDEERLAREIAFLAEKWDLNEEVVRFRSHIELFVEALDGSAEEPVGKRLGFLVQEMHREANTIGSKANDTEVGHASVAIKEEIERLREQIENVE
ncbi:MAG: YicC/YloC family endoribonuclease [Gemmatimonadota bacterium]